MIRDKIVFELHLAKRRKKLFNVEKIKRFSRVGIALKVVPNNGQQYAIRNFATLDREYDPL